MKMLSQIKRFFFPKSLMHRFVLIILIPLLMLQIVMVTFFYERHWDIVSRRLALDITGDIKVITTLIEQVPRENLAQWLAVISRHLSLEGAYYPEQFLEFAPQKNAPNTHLKNLQIAVQDLGYPYQMHTGHHHGQEVTLQLKTGTLQIYIPKKRFFTSTVHVFLLWMLGSFILLFLMAFLFMKNQVRSIQKLSIAAEKFGRGIVVPFRPSGAAEVKQAGRSFILMKRRLGRYVTERTALLASVSHDLKTPLTRMKLQLSLMPKNQDVIDLTEDVAEMEKMVLGYLDFAKGQGQEEPQEFALDDIVRKCVNKARRLKQDVNLVKVDPIPFYGRMGEIERAITNVLTNAGRYAKRAEVSLEKSSKGIIVTIDDDGPGIPKNQREDVFKAFYRLEKSRNTTTGGIGLGLTITRDIILGHGGTIDLLDSPLGGLRVRIVLEKEGD